MEKQPKTALWLNILVQPFLPQNWLLILALLMVFHLIRIAVDPGDASESPPSATQPAGDLVQDRIEWLEDRGNEYDRDPLGRGG